MTDVSFDQALDFSRGTEATYYDANGTLQTAGPDEPRFTHDPETGQPQGLLIEEQRTNLLEWSSDLALVGSSGVGDVVEDQSSGLSLVTEDTSASSHRFTFWPVVQVGEVYTASVRVKQYSSDRYVLLVDTVSDVRAAFDLSNGDYVTNGSPNIRNVGVIPEGNGIYRIFLSYVATEGPQILRIDMQPEFNTSIPGYAGDPTKGAYIGQPQLEPGSTPSSYIKTTDTQVTRAADNVSRELGAEFNATSFSYLVTLRTNSPSSNTDAVHFEVPGAFLVLTILDGEVFLGGQGGLTIYEGDTRETLTVAVSCDSSGQNASVNGGPVASLPNAVPEFETLTLSNRGPDYLNGVIFDFHIIPRALSEQELITLTTPEAN